ncbi:hypothetical protein V8Z74_14765 [Comamonas sp. w2-DMI]|uniref:hypothetical protein n=1 Tax=Comamonas sp. w2-DMI TaxID=3126391 RepID=UPI0032E4BEF1
MNSDTARNKNTDQGGKNRPVPKPAPKPIYLVEADAAQFIKHQRFSATIWNTREARVFGFFVEYLRMLQINSYEQIDPGFFNTLRHNVIQTYYEGALNNQGLISLCTGIDDFLNSKFDSGLTPLFFEDELFDLIHERKKYARFDADAFEDVLADLRYHSLHTESALLEVVRYLGLTLKEAMLLNPALTIDYARKNGSIVIRNQDAQMARRIPIWNEEQMRALIRLATNRLIHDPSEEYKTKRFAYLFSPLSQVYKYLGNNELSVYSLRKAYFDDEFYRNADVSMSLSDISAHAHMTSHLLGHPYCFDESLLIKPLDERKIASAQAILEKHPKQLSLPDPIHDYIQNYYDQKSKNENDS